MTYEQEQKIKAMAAEQAACSNQASTAGSLGGYACKQEEAPSLRDRIHSQLRQARSESQRLEKLAELDYLLEKNPETARILELYMSLWG